MANNPHLATASRNAALDAALDVLNGGGFLKFYDGTQPTNANTALGSQTLLATLALNATAFGAAAGGSKTANAITSAAIAASGTCTWCTLVKSDNSTRVQDMSVGTASADMIIDSVVFSAGAQLSCSSIVESMAA